MIKQKIQQRRYQLGVHSVIYYMFATSIINDKTFDKWGYELKKLQSKYPEISKEVKFYKEFKDWDGTTGYHLIDCTIFTEKARKLMQWIDKQKGEIK